MIARLACLAAALLLVGCAAAPTGPAYRDTGQPLSVTTRSDPARLAGDWELRAATSDDAPTVLTYRPSPAGDSFALARRICADGTCETRRATYDAHRLGPNRWRLAGPGAPPELWLVWVDEGYRTAAFGTPDGHFGWIVDRAATGGQDRIRAAREILEFNGYKPGALVMRRKGDTT